MFFPLNLYERKRAMRRINRHSAVACVVGAACGLVGASVATAQQTCYRVTDIRALGFLPGTDDIFGINNLGEVAFTAEVNEERYSDIRDIRDSHLFTSPLSSLFIKVCSPWCVCVCDIRDSHLFTSPLSSPFIKVCSPSCVFAWVGRRQALAVDPLPPRRPILGPFTAGRTPSLDILTE